LDSWCEHGFALACRLWGVTRTRPVNLTLDHDSFSSASPARKIHLFHDQTFACEIHQVDDWGMAELDFAKKNV
jgi:hypothetical protein